MIWYKLINSGQSSTLSVSNQLITKDSRFSVAYYSIDRGFSPAKWDLHITNVRLSDAAHYQCHVTTKDNRKSIRSNVKLVVEGKERKTFECTCGHAHIYMYIDTQSASMRNTYERSSYLLDRRDNHARVKSLSLDRHLLDILVDIHPTNAYVSIGDPAEFSCNFTGQHRVRSENVTWLKGQISSRNFINRLILSLK